MKPRTHDIRVDAERSFAWQRRHLALGCLALCAGIGCGRGDGPAAPGGGPEVSLDYGVFAAEIEPILQQRGCSNVGCHGGQGSGQLLLSGGAFPQADFIAVGGHVTPWDPPQSPLLRKPLDVESGGLVHGGGVVFADVSDPDYQTLLQWVAPEEAP